MLMIDIDGWVLLVALAAIVSLVLWLTSHILGVKSMPIAFIWLVENHFQD